MKWMIFCIIGLVGCSANKQMVQSPEESNTFEGKIYVDRFDQVFVLTKDREINMYDKNDQLLFNYANDQIGNISSLDVSNPQNILAYISDFGVIKVLDNTLSELSNINITNLGFLDVECVAAANDGYFWLYDPINFRLVKIDTDGKKIAESNRLSDYNIESFRPLHMIERSNKVMLSTSTGQLLVFDNFGQYIRSFPLDEIEKFMVGKDEISYIDKDKLKSYNIKYLEYDEVPFEGECVDFDRNRMGVLVLLKSNGEYERIEDLAFRYDH